MNPFGRLNPVHPRHLYVHEDDFRQMNSDLIDSFLCRQKRADHFAILSLFQQFVQPAQSEIFIIYQNHSHMHNSSGSLIIL
ncbi:hypothetical protein D3C74_394090 [compost metagenome]